MIKQRVSRDCPHSRRANGVVLMSTDMLAALSGAVKDPDEWAIVLQGTKSEDSYEITVTGWRLPEQERTSGHVDLSKDIVQTPFSNPPGNDVAVLHSHCDFGARFSTLDIDKLNTRYPASIVISQTKAALLGFDYQAVGKVTLPCGGKGEIDFHIQPMAEIELATVSRVTHNKTDLGDCTRYHNVAEDQWRVQWKGECGLVEPKVTPKSTAFGVTNDLLDIVAKLPRERDHKVKQEVGFNDSRLREVNYQRTKSIWVCPKDKSDLFWSLVKVGELYCDKCSGYFVPPENTSKTKSEQTKTKFVGNECPPHDFYQGVCIDCDQLEDPDEMYLCQVCGKYDGFTAWDCSICRDSTWCSRCEVGHGDGMDCLEVSA